MKCLWLENKVLTYRENVPVPSVPEGEIQVKVLRAGVCNTDLELMKGYYPYAGILGHEFVGIVDDVNAPEELKGKRVVGEINCVCHKCKFCQSHMERHCSNRTVLGITNRWGTFAEYLCLPKENLFIVPDNIPSQDLCFVEPLAAALEIQEQICIKPSDRVAIIGDGKLGLLISKTIKLTGCDLTVYGHHERNLDLLKADQIKTCLEVNQNENNTYDIVIECSGNGKSLKQAVDFLRPRGTLIMKSTHEGTTEINTAAIVVKELTLIGSRCGSFDKALDVLKSGKIHLKGLLDKEYTFDKSSDAIEYARQKGVLKVQLVMVNEEL